MPRPGLATLACVNPAGHRVRLTGQATLTVRPVYGQAPSRLRRCRPCGEEGAARCGTAWLQTHGAAAPAPARVPHRGDGWGGRAPARLGHVSPDTGARLRRIAGRHAARCPDGRGRAVPPRALAWDAQGRVVTQSRSGAGWRRAPRRGPGGTRPPAPPPASGWGHAASAHGPPPSPSPWGTRPSSGSVRGLGRPSSPRPLRVMRRPASQRCDAGSRPPTAVPQAGLVVRSDAGRRAGPRGRGKNLLKGVGASGAKATPSMATPGCRRACILSV
jgi:hypothetical protein